MQTGQAQVRLGFIGCGRATGELHLPALRRVPEIDVGALADVDERRLQSTGDRFGVAARYTDYEKMLDDPRIDAVAVCVPPQLHAELALAVLAAGKHLFVEKPLALSLTDCDRVIQQASLSPFKSQVGLNFRQHALVGEARRAIAQGELGDVELLRSRFTAATRHRFDLPAWRNRRESGGGVLTEIATHHFDLWRFLLGAEVQEIFAKSRSDGTEDLSAAVTGRMSNGALVSAVFSERTYGSNELEIFGLAASLRVDLYCFDGFERVSTLEHAGDSALRLRRLRRTLSTLPRGLLMKRSGGEFLMMYQRQWRRFAGAILRGEPIAATLEDGRAAVAVAMAAVESAAIGRPVEVAGCGSETRREGLTPRLRCTSVVAEDSLADVPTDLSTKNRGAMSVQSDRPLMSVVIVTPDDFRTIRKTMSHLQAQTVRERLEIVIVAPSRAGLCMDEQAMPGFARTTLVEAGQVTSIGRANAAGIRRATAPIVVLAEDHCFPDPNWAERLIAAHDGPWVAVGPGVRNANPGTCVSWADLFIGYGPWLIPADAKEADFLPGHNSSYRRDVLIDYGDRLEGMMEAETLLHWDLRARGYRLFHETSACVAHTNFSLWSSWLPLQFSNGRHFAACRARPMSRFQRSIYACGSPLIPAVRLSRMIRCVLQRRSGQLLGRLLTCLPAVTVGLILDACGQMMGYALGPGDSQDRLARYEFHRIRHITSRDRQTLFA
jgi:predicted dehydrogenase